MDYNNIEYDKLNDLKLSLSKAFGEILYSDLTEISIDVYFLKKEAVPTDITSKFGTCSADAFSIVLLDEIKQRLTTITDIWRFHQTAFAVPHLETNCEGFTICFEGFKKQIDRKTIKVTVCKETVL